MAMPSVKILFEYIEPLLAAKRHKSETTGGVIRIIKENSFVSLNSFNA